MSAAAGAGFGIVSALAFPDRLDAAADALQTRLDNPPYPSWKTEFRQLAPNVYAYTQAGGPGVPSSAISNGACILGPDHRMAIDAFAAPPHTKAFLAAAKTLAGSRSCDRLINTHHHADHTTGTVSSCLRKSSVTSIAATPSSRAASRTSQAVPSHGNSAWRS